jgi:hypothetical protein
MNTETFATHIHEAMSQHPMWFELERELPVTMDEVVDFEDQSGYCLPSHYIYFASNYGCGYFAFTVVLSIRPGAWYLVDRMPSLPCHDEPFVPIAENGCGDFYGFLVRQGVCTEQVYFADHEHHYCPAPTAYRSFFEFIYHVGLVS